MRLGWLVGALILTLALLTSCHATLHFFAPLFGEQVKDLVAFNKFVVGAYIPHYVVVVLASILYKPAVHEWSDLFEPLAYYFLGYSVLYILPLSALLFPSPPLGSVAIFTVLSSAGSAASMYSGIEIEVVRRRIEEEKLKVRRINERTFLLIEDDRRLVGKRFKGFSEDVLDDVLSGVANWLRLREVEGVQRLVRLDADEMCVFAQYVEGKSLREYVAERGGMLSEEDAACICLKIAMVLKEALSRGIVHRDLKPENVIISQSGDVTVVDWEFSMRLDAKPKTSIGTLPYAPPEGKILTEKYDVYSLGVMLQEMLTGKPYGVTLPTLKNENLKKLLEEMTSLDPRSRASIDKVIESLRQICPRMKDMFFESLART
jgi:hypothetical protein